MYDQRAEKISIDLLKTEEKIVKYFYITNLILQRKLNHENEKERKQRIEEHKYDVVNRAREVRREAREVIKHIKEKVEKKHQKNEDGVDTARKEREHEIMMKREVRMLKEEDFKKVSERHKRKDQIKKMYYIEKEIESLENLERLKAEKDRLAKENAERHMMQAVERSALENAVAKLLHI